MAGTQAKVDQLNVNHTASSLLPTPRGQSQTPVQNSSLDLIPQGSLHPFAATAAAIGFLSTIVRVADEMAASQRQTVVRSKMTMMMPCGSSPALVDTAPAKMIATIVMRLLWMCSWLWIRIHLAAVEIRASSTRQTRLLRFSSVLLPPLRLSREASSVSRYRVVDRRWQGMQGAVVRMSLTWWRHPHALMAAQVVVGDESWLL